MKTTLDIAALAQAFVLPLVVLVLALAYRAHVLELLKTLGSRVKGFSLGGVSIELSEATQLTIATDAAAVDLRHAGQSADVNDSTLRTFYEQVSETQTLDYAVVDLGEGEQWLSSRLYILSFILRRMRGLKTMVLVETSGHVRRRFLGTCDCERIRWKLGKHCPWFEAALALAEVRTWLLSPTPVLPEQQPIGGELLAAMSSVRIVNDEGRVEDYGGPQAAAELLRRFLDGIQTFGPALDTEWATLPSSPSNPQAHMLSEHAEWLTGARVEQLLGEALQRSSVRLSDLRGKTEAEKVRLVLDQPDRWIATTRDDGAFDRLIDRTPIAEKVTLRAMAT